MKNYTYTYEPEPGEDFRHAAEEAKEMALVWAKNVRFDFNGITCIVSESTNLDYLWRYFQDAFIMDWKEVGPDCEAEYTPDIQTELTRRNQEREEKRIREVAEYNRKESEARQAFNAKVEGISFEVSNPELWQKGLSNNQDPYGACICEYAEGWAKLMQMEMANGIPLVDCAERTSFEMGFLGITGFMYGAAVSVLSACWKHGEALRKWHNKEYGHDGDGVVNPAILTIPS